MKHFSILGRNFLISEELQSMYRPTVKMKD